MAKRVILAILFIAVLLAGCVGPDGGDDPTSPADGGSIISDEPIITVLATSGFSGNSYGLRVSKKGFLAYFIDTDGDGTSDSIATHMPNGGHIKTVRLTGPDGLIGEGAVMDNGILDVSEDGDKIVFIATIPPDRDEYAGEKHIFVLEPRGVNTPEITDIRPYELLGSYAEEEDAGRVDPSWVVFNPDATKIAFIARVWGIEMGGAHDIDNAVAVVDIDGSNVYMIERGVQNGHLGFDYSGKVHYAKIVMDGLHATHYLTHSLAEKPVEERLKLGGQSMISVSEDGTIAGTVPGGRMFVGGRDCDFEPWLDVKITSDGGKILATDWNEGLYVYDMETLEAEEIAPPLGDEKQYSVFDASASAQVVVFYIGKTGELIHMFRR